MFGSLAHRITSQMRDAALIMWFWDALWLTRGVFDW
jgi:hypothetical protein